MDAIIDVNELANVNDLCNVFVVDVAAPWSAMNLPLLSSVNGQIFVITSGGVFVVSRDVELQTSFDWNIHITRCVARSYLRSFLQSFLSGCS